MGKWETVAFDDALTIINGKNQKQVENPSGKYPIYGSGGVMGYADDYLCEANTVVIGRKGTINRPLFVEEPFWNVDTAFGLCAKNTLHPKYLFYFCEQFDFETLNTTVTIPSLTKANLLKIKIPLPPLPVQQQIADVLDRVSALIEKRKAQIDKLDLLMKSQFIEMFGDPVTNPKEWEVVAIGDIETKIRSGLSRKLSNDDIGVPVIRSTNMINGYMDTSDIKYWYINDPQGADVPSYFLKSGDILVNFINSNEHIGKVCIYFDIGRECIYTTNIFVMNLNDKCNSIWFNQYAKTDAYKYQLRNIIQPAVNQSSFTTANYRKLKIPLPPISIQNEFADFVRQVETQISLLQQSLAKLEQNYKSLMQKCFRGEIF